MDKQRVIEHIRMSTALRLKGVFSRYWDKIGDAASDDTFAEIEAGIAAWKRADEMERELNNQNNKG